MFCIFSSLLLTAPLGVAAELAEVYHQHVKKAQVSAKELKSWYDQNKDMTVIDARAPKSFNDTVLPNAIWLPSESTEQEISAKLPSKNDLIVVYCWGHKCVASAWLLDKLISMGYTNVHKYHKGLEDWMDHGYATQTLKIQK